MFFKSCLVIRISDLNKRENNVKDQSQVKPDIYFLTKLWGYKTANDLKN